MQNYRPTNFLLFRGNGGELFKILLINFFLTVFTLGLYYPWAKANYLKFLYNNSEFKNSRFQFNGTGKEMVKGFIKVYAFFAIFVAAMFYAQLNQHLTLYFTLVGIFYFLVILIMPLALHGSNKYRMSRTSWRSIRFGYRGSLNELAILYYKGILFSILTFGIYLFWFIPDLRRYLLGHTRFGDISFNYTGKGIDFFIMHLKGIILTMITCGIYGFWYQRDIMRFEINNLEMNQNGNILHFSTSVTGGEIFVFSLVNQLLIMFTLGIATPWVICRTIEFYFANIDIVGEFDDNALQQTEEKYTNATGEEFLDQADFDLGIFDF
jgi:uncharacterized membrane protein YjgN (DUF898 family)